MSATDECPSCGGDCGTSGCEDDAEQQPLDDDFESGPCEHEHDEDDCYDYQGFFVCAHTHCGHCGGCRCPGYCDDYQTYNLRPAETGGPKPAAMITDRVG